MEQTWKNLLHEFNAKEINRIVQGCQIEQISNFFFNIRVN